MPSDHLAYISILSDPAYQSRVKVFCYSGSGLVHCKAYAWRAGEKQSIGYSGSANYSSEAFIGNQRNQLTKEDPACIADLYRELLPDCTDIMKAPVVSLLTAILANLNSGGSVKPGGWD